MDIGSGLQNGRNGMESSAEVSPRKRRFSLIPCANQPKKVRKYSSAGKRRWKKKKKKKRLRQFELFLKYELDSKERRFKGNFGCLARVDAFCRNQFFDLNMATFILRC